MNANALHASKRFVQGAACLMLLVVPWLLLHNTRALADTDVFYCQPISTTSGGTVSNANCSATYWQPADGADYDALIDLGVPYSIASIHLHSFNVEGGCYVNDVWTFKSGSSPSCCTGDWATVATHNTGGTSCDATVSTTGSPARRYWYVHDTNTDCNTCIWRVSLWQGFTTGGFVDTPTSTPTATRTPTPTNTNTPTVTLTPLCCGTPVIGNCGAPGQIPCNVYWLTPQTVHLPSTTTIGITGTVVISGHVQVDNWPTVIPTNTPLLGISNQQTVQAIAIGVSPPAPGSYGGASGGITVFSPYGGSGGTHFVETTAYTFGCPFSAPPVGASACLTYHYITALNVGPIAVPSWPFTVVCVLFLFGLVVRR